ncbi:hypothetical protein ACUH89_08780, partial [Dermabacteraceae bacterium P13264]
KQGMLRKWKGTGITRKPNSVFPPETKQPNQQCSNTQRCVLTRNDHSAKRPFIDVPPNHENHHPQQAVKEKLP